MSDHAPTCTALRRVRPLWTCSSRSTLTGTWPSAGTRSPPTSSSRYRFLRDIILDATVPRLFKTDFLVFSIAMLPRTYFLSTTRCLVSLLKLLEVMIRTALTRRCPKTSAVSLTLWSLQRCQRYRGVSDSTVSVTQLSSTSLCQWPHYSGGNVFPFQRHLSLFISNFSQWIALK